MKNPPDNVHDVSNEPSATDMSLKSDEGTLTPSVNDEAPLQDQVDTAPQDNDAVQHDSESSQNDNVNGTSQGSPTGKSKKTLWTYLITAGVGLLITLLVLIIRSTFTQTAAIIIYQDLCDAFFIPGASFLCVGALVWASNGGAFDMLRYGAIRFVDRFRKDVINRKYHTFYDYREAQKSKHRSFLYFFLVGLAFVVVAVVFYAVFKVELDKLTGNQ